LFSATKETYKHQNNWWSFLIYTIAFQKTHGGSYPAASLIRWAVEKLVAAYEAAGRPAQAWKGIKNCDVPNAKVEAQF
jgi:hypothetical protein